MLAFPLLLLLFLANVACFLEKMAKRNGSLNLKNQQKTALKYKLPAGKMLQIFLQHLLHATHKNEKLQCMLYVKLSKFNVAYSKTAIFKRHFKVKN